MHKARSLVSRGAREKGGLRPPTPRLPIALPQGNFPEFERDDHTRLVTPPGQHEHTHGELAGRVGGGHNGWALADLGGGHRGLRWAVFVVGGGLPLQNESLACHKA